MPYVNPLLERWRTGRPVLATWLSFPDPLVAELLASSGWDAVIVDQQHGAAGPRELASLFMAIQAGGSWPLTRVPPGDLSGDRPLARRGRARHRRADGEHCRRGTSAAAAFRYGTRGRSIVRADPRGPRRPLDRPGRPGAPGVDPPDRDGGRTRRRSTRSPACPASTPSWWARQTWPLRSTCPSMRRGARRSRPGGTRRPWPSVLEACGRAGCGARHSCARRRCRRDPPRRGLPVRLGLDRRGVHAVRFDPHARGSARQARTGVGAGEATRGRRRPVAGRQVG